MRQATRERQARLLSEVLDKRHVTVKKLAENMAVSPATVRRDLKALSDNRKVNLVHGGATLPENADFSFYAKQDRNQQAKLAIGRVAAELVAAGEQIFLDSGTTSLAMAKALGNTRGLSIIINSARLALELEAPAMNLIIVGGQYRPDRMDTVGPIANSTLDQLRGYIAFLGADGLSMNSGIWAADIESAHLNRLAVTNARQSVLLVDHTKFEAASLFKIVEWDMIDKLVTDEPPSDEWMRFLQDHEIEVLLPRQEGEAENGNQRHEGT